MRDAYEPRAWMRMQGIKRDWLCTSVTAHSAGEMARGSFFADPEWGDPLAAYAWEQETWRGDWDCESETKAIACLYPNGRVLDVRFNKKGARISHYPSKGGTA